MVVHSVKHISMRNITSCERKERIIFIIYLDKIPPKGSLVVECGKILEENGYNVRCFNTVNFQKSMHYNPFKYIRSEKDIIQENLYIIM